MSGTRRVEPVRAAFLHTAPTLHLGESAAGCLQNGLVLLIIGGLQGMLEDHIRLKNINHITYNVKDKDAALQWYQDILGLKQIPKMVNSDHLYWLQLPSGAMVHIIENPDAPSAPSHHTAFEVDDLDAARDALMAKGIVVTEIQTRNDGQKAMYLQDLDGNRIELCTKSGFGVLV